MKAIEVANTIKNQMSYGQRNTMRVMSWGARKYGYGIDKGSNLGYLVFLVSGYKFKGTVKISLSFNDTYKVEFIKNKRTKDKDLSELYGSTKFITTREVVNTMEEVYCDELNERIDVFVEKQDNYSY